ncbi:cytochrome P450 [Chitinophaga sp. 22536]|uniref:cytochrome P450 n=1 Tax=Chitinophaga sp. 22536 TaxID=3453939 RepID=UPI003F847A24
MSEHKELIPSFIEELLRFRITVPTLCQIVKEDTVINHQYLKKGDIVTAWICTASRDRAVFDSQIYLTLKEKQHLNICH